MRKLVSAIFVLSIVAISAPATAQSVDDLQERVVDLEEKVVDLRTRYMEPALLKSKYKLEARFNEAKVAYFLENYREAAILFVDVAENEKFRNFESYREALYLLGDSLIRLRNYQAAKRYLDQLLEMGPGPYYQEGASALLQIAFETRNYSDADDIYALLNKSGSLNPSLAYQAGKALYQQGKYADARQSFQTALSDPEFAMVARYYIGVTYAAEKNFDAANNTFQAIVDSPSMGTPRDEQVIDLAYIALGRVAYENQNLELAIDYYARPERGSPHFDRALWEMTWVLIAQKNYPAAKRNVELFLIDDPDPEFEPEARMLQADLSLRLGSYEEAQGDYEELLDRFRPIKQEMDEFVAEHQDLPAFFGTLVEDELRGVEPEFLPPRVDRFIGSNKTMQSTRQVLSDVRDVSLQIDDSLRMLDEISSRLNSSTRIQFFPELADGMSRGIELESKLIQTRRDLIKEEYEVIEPGLSPEEKQAWQAQRAELNLLAERVEQAPKTVSEQAERERIIVDEFDRLRRAIDKVGYMIDSQRAQLAAVDVYIENQYGRELSEKELAEVKERRKEILERLREFERLRAEIQREIDYAREGVGVGDAVSMAESELRQRFRAELADARQWLEQRRSKAPAAASAKLTKIERVRSRLPEIEAKLDGYFATMDQLMDERVAEIAGELETERELVMSHRQSIRELITQSQTGAGVLAYLNFMRGRAELTDIILRGEVGLTNVSWQRKDDMTKKINNLFEDRTLELRQLQDHFEEIR